MTTVWYVCHGLNGCETGCCGYRLCPDDEGDEQVGKFTFDHPGRNDTPETFARRVWSIPSNIEIQPGKWFNCTE